MNDPLKGFIQGYWIRAKGDGTTPAMQFTGGKKFYGVLRNRIDGLPLVPNPLAATDCNSQWTMSFPSLLEAPGREALLYLFDTETAGKAYQDHCSKPWDQTALLSLLDQKRLPDLVDPHSALLLSAMVAQGNSLTALAALVAQRNAQLGVVATSLATTSGVQPIGVVLGGQTTVQMAAPGSPPQWIP